MKTKPGGRAARTDLPPEIPEELKALDDAALLDALETQPPAVAATRAARPGPKEPSTLGRVQERRARPARAHRLPHALVACGDGRRGLRVFGPDGAFYYLRPRGALEKTSSTNAFTNAAARALVATDADAYQREEWPLSAKNRARACRRQDSKKYGRRVTDLRGRF